MSQENVALVQKGFEAWRGGRVEVMLELLDPEIEWTVRSDLPDAGIYRGHEELGRLFARFEDVLEDQWFEPQEFIEAGEGRVVVPLHWGGRGKLSGVEVAERQGETWVFTIDNERIVRVVEYRRKAEALEATGLSE
jgi:uncharacterized protein